MGASQDPKQALILLLKKNKKQKLKCYKLDIVSLYSLLELDWSYSCVCKAGLSLTHLCCMEIHFGSGDPFRPTKNYPWDVSRADDSDPRTGKPWCAWKLSLTTRGCFQNQLTEPWLRKINVKLGVFYIVAINSELGGREGQPLSWLECPTSVTPPTPHQLIGTQSLCYGLHR